MNRFIVYVLWLLLKLIVESFLLIHRFGTLLGLVANMHYLLTSVWELAFMFIIS